MPNVQKKIIKSLLTEKIKEYLSTNDKTKKAMLERTIKAMEKVS